MRTKEAVGIIIKRRLGNLRELVQEYGLYLQISFVPSMRNKADILTRVKKSWLSVVQEEKCEDICNAGVTLEDVYNLNHMEVERTLYLAPKLDPDVSRE